MQKTPWFSNLLKQVDFQAFISNLKDFFLQLFNIINFRILFYYLVLTP